MDVQTFYSPIHNDTICAPGATPFFSGRSGKFAAAIAATCVPWLSEKKKKFFHFKFKIFENIFCKRELHINLGTGR